MIRVRVQEEDFDSAHEIVQLRASSQSIGAIVSFIGLVRDQSHGEGLVSMTLEHYPGMTERELSNIAEQAVRRWNLDGIVVVHRTGRLQPADQIVLVLTASRHRADAFDAAQYLMDYLKVKAPFWKKEERKSGEYWVEARSSDDNAAARWDE